MSSVFGNIFESIIEEVSLLKGYIFNINQN